MVGCAHKVNGQMTPCPSTCPAQSWPPHLFERRLGRWQLRSEHEPYARAWEWHASAFRVYAAQWDDGAHPDPNRLVPPPPLPRLSDGVPPLAEDQRARWEEHAAGVEVLGGHAAGECEGCDRHREHEQLRAEVAAGQCHTDLGRGLMLRSGACPHEGGLG